jgi:hypothetical protein
MDDSVMTSPFGKPATTLRRRKYATEVYVSDCPTPSQKEAPGTEDAEDVAHREMPKLYIAHDLNVTLP